MNNKIRFFTLLELLVAVMIFAIVSASAAMALSTFMKGWDRIHSNHDRQVAIHQITNLTGMAFRNAIPFTWKNQETLSEEPIFIGEKDFCYLAYRHRLSSDENSSIRFIKLYIEEDKLIAMYYPTPPLQDDANNMKQEIIATGIKEINFLYAANENNEITFDETWETTETADLPIAIQLEVVWEDDTVSKWLRRTIKSRQ